MNDIMSFEEYCEELYGVDTFLMSASQLAGARDDYEKSVRRYKCEKAKESRAAKLEKAKESRKLAKLFGGKALTGSAAQKKWAEDIRQKVLGSFTLSDEQKVRLATIGGAVNTARFWIDNRDKSPAAFYAAAIIKK